MQEFLSESDEVSDYPRVTLSSRILGEWGVCDKNIESVDLVTVVSQIIVFFLLLFSYILFIM